MGELKSRVEAQKKQLESDLLTAKADAQGAGSEAVTKIKKKLNELEDMVKEGWEDLSDGVRDRLDKWLHRGDDD